MKLVFPLLVMLAAVAAGPVSQAEATTIDFTGAYAVGNWTSSPGAGTIDTTGAPSSIFMVSPDNGDTTNTDFTYTAFQPATINFKWSYGTGDSDGPFYDPFGWLLNGSFTQVTDSGGPNSQAGVVSFEVLPGDVFGFRADTVDAIFGPAGTTISEFTVSEVPEPATLSLLGVGLAALAFRRLRRV